MRTNKAPRLAYDPFIGRGVDGLIRSTAPEEQIEPFESEEPIEPNESFAPVEPTEPVEPMTPNESIEQLAPSDPTAPKEPSEPKVRRSISFHIENMTHLQLMAGFRNMSVDKYLGELCQADRAAKAELVQQLKKLKGE